MSKHRSQKTHHRKIAVAAVAVAAVGVPSVAMACLDGQDNKGSEARGEWTTTARHHGHTDSDKKNDHRWKHRADRSKPAPSASRSASPRHTPSARPSSAAPSSAAPTRTAPAKATTKAASPSSAAPASSTATKSSGSSLQDQIVALVNKERAKVGCKPVTVDAKLTKAAQAHSEDMAAHSNMSHTGSDGSSPDDRIERAGYSWSTYGENVAYGYSSPESVMQGWMNSSGHKANILNCDFKEIGVGHAQPGHYWTQDFAAAR
ncbi:CAP domain-containing protein [Streptomyces coffeae]|uniref:CAP domain-containing protein n=1 Tax=Streptomyces coffeae TaxID=621382 RepID=A0ABS1NBS5_9ACTN|nr:CAP domain-containing protein [Streptomyces coffeae]MBL1097380.1 CAP domain-containing protein [Streptomyces coffeae]